MMYEAGVVDLLIGRQFSAFVPNTFILLSYSSLHDIPEEGYESSRQQFHVSVGVAITIFVSSYCHPLRRG